MESTKQRLDYIDLARGIAIFSVVLGHAYSPSGGQVVIPLVYSFHMPFFFIISGVLLGHKAASGATLSFRLKNKLQTLLLPYVFWGLFCQLAYAALALIGGATISSQIDLIVKNILTLTNGPMWFLLAMFLAQFLFLFAIRKPLVHMIYCAVLMIAAIFIPSLPTVLGSTVLQAFVGCFFMAVGFHASALFLKKAKWPFLLLLSLVNIVLIFQNGTVSVAALSFGNPALFILNGCLGSWLLTQYCIYLFEWRWVKTISKPIVVWGKYSIVILCLHYFVIECLRIVDHKLFDSILPELGHAEGPILSVAVMIVLSLSMPLLLRFFSWSWGLKRPHSPIYRS